MEKRNTKWPNKGMVLSVSYMTSPTYLPQLAASRLLVNITRHGGCYIKGNCLLNNVHNRSTNTEKGGNLLNGAWMDGFN
jgi:hypothetical protein